MNERQFTRELASIEILKMPIKKRWLEYGDRDSFDDGHLGCLRINGIAARQTARRPPGIPAPKADNPLRDNTFIAYPYASTPDEPALHQGVSMSVD
jgi:hypothetical protein